jgi:hypothetical protein
MERRPWALASLAVACALALGACSKRAEDSPVAPGRPGTGNGVDVVKPAVPDSPPGGSSGMAGSLPAGGDAPVGTTGHGMSDSASGSGQATIPGTGLHGGLGTGENVAGSASTPTTDSTTRAPTSAPSGSGMGAGPGLGGSTNMTTHGSVGNR